VPAGHLAQDGAQRLEVRRLSLPGRRVGRVEVVRRSGGEASWLFVVNHGEQDVELAATGTEQLSGARCDTALRVPAGGVRILRQDPTP